MSEVSKKVDEFEEEAKVTELSERDLEKVAGGASGDGIGGVGVGLRKHKCFKGCAHDSTTTQ